MDDALGDDIPMPRLQVNGAPFEIDDEMAIQDKEDASDVLVPSRRTDGNCLKNSSKRVATLEYTARARELLRTRRAAEDLRGR
jgi:hypothetical protein